MKHSLSCRQITPTFWKFFTFSVSVFRCVFFYIQLVIMSAGQRILILEALLVKVLFRCTIARIWGLVERSCFRKTLSVGALSLSVRERCLLDIKEIKVISVFIGRTTLVSVVLRVQHWYPRARDLTELELVANVGFCEGRKLDFLRGKTLNRDREATRNSSR